ncbi:hypothetical protein EW145_g7062 [Phellinidium pouzarii]|uniref:Uncharacterized protein n=1 Tax=Phellinidium pouzarii TaxID=167371 RepID=A0A4V6S109_9AGAM|nr:hypothetical protein EW145_g7062 [Phellinidium pouzarii]
MRSFNILSLVATAAFSLLAVAAPLSNVNAHVDSVDKDISIRALEVPKVDASINTRDSIKSVPVILNDLSNDLSAVLVEINSLTTSNCTNATVTPLLNQVVDIVGTAVSDIKKLVGAPVTTILASVDGTATAAVTDVAQLLANILTLVINALGAVLKLVNGDLSILGTALAAVGKILVDLVSGVSSVVDGLISDLGPLIGSLVPTLTALAFNTLGVVLNLVL